MFVRQLDCIIHFIAHLFELTNTFVDHSHIDHSLRDDHSHIVVGKCILVNFHKDDSISHGNLSIIHHFVYTMFE